MCHGNKYRSSFEEKQVFTDLTGLERPRTIKQFKFYKHLRTYVIVNAVFFFMTLANGDPKGWFPMAFFWGIGLYFHYRKAFPSNNTGAHHRPRQIEAPKYEDELVDEIPIQEEQPNWRESDLV